MDSSGTVLLRKVRIIFVVIVIYLVLKNYLIKTEEHLHFTEYIRRYNRSYDDIEYLKRKQYYEDSLREISRLNFLHGSPVFGVNKFTDLSPQERAEIAMDNKLNSRCEPWVCRSCPTPFGKDKGNDTFAHGTDWKPVPEKVDWREKGVVGPIVNQKRCRGCWAFSIVGVMESMWAIIGNGFHSLSIQEVIDCTYRSSKCAGGGIGVTLHFLCTHDYPVVDADDYRLMLISQECRMPRKLPNGRKIASYVVNCTMDEWWMLKVIAEHGPIIAAVNSNPLMYYNSGVISKACDGKEESMTHVIQIVGYDLKAEVPYYIVRNSWGDDFGENGYLRIAIFNNVCGLSNNVAYLTVK